MKDRYTKLEDNLILDTNTGKILRNPLLIIDKESYLIIDIVDDYITKFFNTDMFSSYDATPNHVIYLRYEMNETDGDLILNNLNGYDYFMKHRDFDSIRYHIKAALGVVDDVDNVADVAHDANVANVENVANVDNDANVANVDNVADVENVANDANVENDVNVADVAHDADVDDVE